MALVVGYGVMTRQLFPEAYRQQSRRHQKSYLEGRSTMFRGPLEILTIRISFISPTTTANKTLTHVQIARRRAAPQSL